MEDLVASPPSAATRPSAPLPPCADAIAAEERMTVDANFILTLSRLLLLIDCSSIYHYSDNTVIIIITGAERLFHYLSTQTSSVAAVYS